MRSYSSPHPARIARQASASGAQLGVLLCALFAFAPELKAQGPGEIRDDTQGEAIVLGDLFCDQDQDGERDLGEPGVGEVRQGFGSEVLVPGT